MNDKRCIRHRAEISLDEVGMRLDKWLGGHPNVSSREMARRLIEQEVVWLNDKPAQPATRIKAHDAVEFQIPPPVPTDLEPEAFPLNILYEDEHLIVVDKEAGVTVHPSPGHRRGTLVHFLLAHCDNLSGIGGIHRPGIVHRLDKDTSGVLVVAKNDLAHQNLSQQFREHTIDRTYLALVVGYPERSKGKIDLPLGRDSHNRLRQTVRADGRRAVTHWWVERRLGRFTLMRLRLETGRTHQIRAHLAYQNWPVVGDPLYGRGRYKGLVLPAHVRDGLGRFRRQALHAVELGFRHPVHGRQLHFDSPLAEDMMEIIRLVSETSDPAA